MRIVLIIIALMFMSSFGDDPPKKKKKEKEDTYIQAQENLEALEELNLKFDSLLFEQDTIKKDTIK